MNFQCIYCNKQLKITDGRDIYCICNCYYYKTYAGNIRGYLRLDPLNIHMDICCKDTHFAYEIRVRNVDGNLLYECFNPVELQKSLELKAFI